MIGITSYGGHIPRWRLLRETVFKEMGWLAPHLAACRSGERAFCHFDEDALTMAVAASRDCLLGQDRSLIDAVHLCSTTLPFADRLNAGILKTALNLDDTLQAADIGGSFRSGTTGLIEALALVKSGERRRVLVTAADQPLSRAGADDELWRGDGAASVLIGTEHIIAEYLGSHVITRDFVDHYRASGRRFDYAWEERFAEEMGYAVLIPEAIRKLLEKISLSVGEVSRFIYPCPSVRAHRKIGVLIGAPPEKIAANLHDVLGETGAAHPLVMLVHTLERSKPGDIIVVAGFGQGCDALCFKVTEHLDDLRERTGIHGALDDKRTTDKYTRFLKFRGLLETDSGIRDEAPSKTALSVLWREREMILGLVGGRCTACDTPQFPRTRICVNPACRAVDAQEPYGFQDKGAIVKTYTGDMLVPCADPPSIYGMIQFDGGGRLMTAFTDCELCDVAIGRRVTMAFRKRYSDEARGFHGYFWKAIPTRDREP